jgi:hypothetical protein
VAVLVKLGSVGLSDRRNWASVGTVERGRLERIIGYAIFAAELSIDGQRANGERVNVLLLLF